MFKWIVKFYNFAHTLRVGATTAAVVARNISHTRSSRCHLCLCVDFSHRNQLCVCVCASAQHPDHIFEALKIGFHSAACVCVCVHGAAVQLAKIHKFNLYIHAYLWHRVVDSTEMVFYHSDAHEMRLRTPPAHTPDFTYGTLYEYNLIPIKITRAAHRYKHSSPLNASTLLARLTLFIRVSANASVYLLSWNVLHSLSNTMISPAGGRSSWSRNSHCQSLNHSEYTYFTIEIINMPFWLVCERRELNRAAFSSNMRINKWIKTRETESEQASEVKRQ